mgnify:CR=1 FL=1
MPINPLPKYINQNIKITCSFKVGRKNVGWDKFKKFFSERRRSADSAFNVIRRMSGGGVPRRRITHRKRENKMEEVEEIIDILDGIKKAKEP